MWIVQISEDVDHKTEEIFVKPKSIIKNEKNIEEIVKTLLLWIQRQKLPALKCSPVYFTIICIYICIWIMAVSPNFNWIGDEVWYGHFYECNIGDTSCLLQKIDVNSFSMVLVKDGTIFVAILSNVMILIDGNFGLQ